MELESIKMTDIRFEKLQGSEGRARMCELLDRAFPVPKGSSFFDDFPVWDPLNDSVDSRVARFGAFGPDGRFLSLAAVRMALLDAPAGPLPAAIIGAVATDEAARGQGLASRTVSVALQWAMDQGAAVALLWGAEHSLYRKLGFELCGEQILAPLAFVPLPPLPAGSAASLELMGIGRGWTPALFDALRERRFGVRLQLHDQTWLAAQKNVEWYWTGERNKPSAYAAIGRGIDMQNIVHEWGGEPSELAMLLSRLLADRPGSALLGPRSLFESYGFEKAITHAQIEYLCLARVLNPARVFKAYHPDIRMHAELSGDGTWSCSFDGAKPVQLADGELSETFFGPNSIKAGAAASAHWLPLPLWVWGLDAG